MRISRNEHAISDRKQSLRRQSLSDKHALDDKRIVVAGFGTCCDGRRARADENICKTKVADGVSADPRNTLKLRVH